MKPSVFQRAAKVTLGIILSLGMTPAIAFAELQTNPNSTNDVSARHENAEEQADQLATIEAAASDGSNRDENLSANGEDLGYLEALSEESSESDTLLTSDGTESSTLSSAEGEIRSGDWGYTVLSDGTAWVCSYYGSDVTLDIPSSIDGITVTKAGFYLASSEKFTPRLSQVEEINVPSSVNTLASWAFRNIPNLRTINFSPECTISYIPDDVIVNTSVERFELPDSVTSISKHAFEYTYNLETVKLSDNLEPFVQSLTVISGSNQYPRTQHQNLFSGISDLHFEVSEACKNFKVVDDVLYSKDGTVLYSYPMWKSESDFSIPSNVTEIAAQAFSYVKTPSVTIPSSVTKISEYAFYASSITSISIPDSVTDIYAGAFGKCTKLETATIGNGITALGTAAGWELFANCTSLSNVTLGTSVTEIGNGCFANTAIETIYIPDSVTQINYKAFCQCANLTSVTGARNVKEINPYAFAETSISSFPFNDNMTFVAGSAFDSCSSYPDPEWPSYLEKDSDGDYVSYDASFNMTGWDCYDYAYEVLDLVNEERASNGLSALSMDKDLLQAAMQRASETSVSFSHTRPNGDSCFSACSTMSGENIAAGQWSPESAMNSWMNSSGHRANILNSSYQSIGIGVFYHAGTYYWVQCFSANSGETASRPNDEIATHKVDVSLSSFDPQLTIVHHGNGNAVTSYIYNSYCYAYPDASSFTWTTDNPNVCAVDENAVLTYRGGGNAVIRAAGNRMAAECLVTVEGDPIDITAIQQFVKRLYSVVLGRTVDPEVDDPVGYNNQVNGVLSMGAAQIGYNFFDSDEFRERNLTYEQQVQCAYKAFFDRDAESGGLEFWVNYLEHSMTINAVVAGFAESQEYASNCAEWGVPTGNSSQIRARETFQARDKNFGVTSFANRLYTIVLNRLNQVDVEGGIDSSGLNVQCQGLINGIACWEIAYNFFNSEEFYGFGYSNSEIVETAYAALLGRSAEAIEADTDGRAYWEQRLQKNGLLDTIQGFCQSDEFEEICRSCGMVSGML